MEWLAQQHNYDDKTPTAVSPPAILRGFIPIEWTTHQQQFYLNPQEFTLKNVTDGPTWASKLIVFMWEQSHLLWTLRNQQAHETEENSLARRDLEAQVSKLYAQRSTIHPTKQRLLFPTTESDVKKYHTKALIQWIDNTTKSLTAVQHKYKGTFQGMNRITTYFASSSRSAP